MIYQSSTNARYDTKLIHMVAYFKKLWKLELKQAWLDYCLINPSGKSGKFMANDQFGERIVLLNKEKVCPSANASTNEFLREIVLMNVIFFWKCQEAVSCATGATLHSNCHSLATKVYDVSLLVKHIIEDSFSREQLGRTDLYNNCTEYAFRDLFAEEVARLSTGVKLGRYIQAACGKWDNYNPDDAADSNNKYEDDKDDENENMGGGL